ncbi:MAG TPA: LysR family transcriptional regulator [Propionicimonas sp.]|uniref:LysR family transcriptional regulator n=1 Tax=Propionicimonas sp. TaxID=1955623 RepID=UPI002F408785
MLDPHRLKVLVAVARCGTLAAAATELHYSQPTISHHLSRLEAETGAVLTQRVGRGLRLTEEGERLARRGEEILALLQRADEELSMATSLRAGRVRLAVFPSAASTVVPETLKRMADRHPGIRVELVEAEPPEARNLLRAGEADVALVFGYRDEHESTAFKELGLGGDILNLITPLSGPLAEPRSLRGHRESPWIAGCPQCRKELLDLAREAGFDPEVGFATDDFVAVEHLVAAGFGVALLPSLALQAYRHPQIVATPLPTSRRHLSALTFGEPPNAPQVDALLRVLAEVRVGHEIEA